MYLSGDLPLVNPRYAWPHYFHYIHITSTIVLHHLPIPHFSSLPSQPVPHHMSPLTAITVMWPCYFCYLHIYANLFPLSHIQSYCFTCMLYIGVRCLYRHLRIQLDSQAITSLTLFLYFFFLFLFYIYYLLIKYLYASVPVQVLMQFLVSLLTLALRTLSRINFSYAIQNLFYKKKTAYIVIYRVFLVF